MSLKQKIAMCTFLVGLGFAMMCGITLMATHIAVGTFLFSFALMLSPLAAIFLLFAGWFMNRGKISKALFGLSGTLVSTALALSVFTPLGTLPGISLPVFMAGTAIGVGAVLLVNPYARFEGPFKIFRPRRGTSAPKPIPAAASASSGALTNAQSSSFRKKAPVPSDINQMVNSY